MTTRRTGQTPSTSAEVARRAGVSRPTVSQILNGRAHLFADDTVKRVLAAAEELNYRPSVAGRALVSGHSDIVVLAVPNVTFGELFQELMDMLTDRFAAAGLILVSQYVHQSLESLRSLVEQLRPALLLDLGSLTPQDRDGFEAMGVPVVGGSEGSAVGHLQVEHLVARGAGRIDYALLSDSRSDIIGPTRAAALAEACQARGLPQPRTIRVPLRLEDAESVLGAHLLLTPRPDAIACYNDEVGAVLVTVARGLGLRVPADLAIIGVDDSPAGRVCVPPLTTIAIDVRPVADLLFEVSMDRLGRSADSAGPITDGLPSNASHVVLREST